MIAHYCSLSSNGSLEAENGMKKPKGAKRKIVEIEKLGSRSE